MRHLVVVRIAVIANSKYSLNIPECCCCCCWWRWWQLSAAAAAAAGGGGGGGGGGAALLLLVADGRGAALHLTESIETKCKDLVVTYFALSKQNALFGG